MCEALRELMKDEIEQDVARGEMRGRVEGIVDTCCDLGLPEDAILERLQKKLNISLQTAQEYLKTFGKQIVKINERQENQKHMNYQQKDLVRIAKRENNTKRNYLVVDPLQGKHVPVEPSKALNLFKSLAEKLQGKYEGERLLLIGLQKLQQQSVRRLRLLWKQSISRQHGK